MGMEQLSYDGLDLGRLDRALEDRNKAIKKAEDDLQQDLNKLQEHCYTARYTIAAKLHKDSLLQQIAQEKEFQKEVDIINNIASTARGQKQLEHLKELQDARKKAEEDQIKSEAEAQKKVEAAQKAADKKQSAKEKEAAEKKLKEAKADLERIKNSNAAAIAGLEEQEKAEIKLQAAKEAAYQKQINNLKNSSSTELRAIGNIKEAYGKAETSGEQAGAIISGLASYTQQLGNTIDSIAGKRSAIDTRLQGLNNGRRWLYGGSYWDMFSKDITGIAGASALYKQTDIVTNLTKMVDQGIAANVEQRAFIATISDKIATTFDATNGTLLRLVRIQQQDTTAARLGMESALTSFLNNMYETTEYMSDLATSTKANLEQSMALMSGESAVGFEYQVQKWLGSMYSVGMGSNAVSSISDALGKLAAGQIEGISSGGTGNLLIMAANNAGLSVADILAEGLDESSTNKLMQAMVNYLAKIYNETADSRVVQQQYANVFGISAADLKAAANLADTTTIGSIYNSSSNYSQSINQLTKMASTMAFRTSQGEMLTNAFDNLNYTMAAGIANNPALYATFKIAGLLNDVAGGIALPAISAMGTGVDLETTVADLMMVGALSGSILSGIGGIVNSLAGSIAPALTLAELGVYGKNSVARGRNSTVLTTSGMSTAESGYVGNSAGGDVYESTMAGANDTTQSKTVEAQESETTDTSNKTIDEHIVAILSLLQEVSFGDALRVQISNTDELGHAISQNI